MFRTNSAIVVFLAFTAVSQAGDHTLTISKIAVRKTPCSGTWRAGVSAWKESKPDKRDSWHGGEQEFEGVEAVLPVALELGGLDSGEVVALFIGLDDDVEDAGGANAEDKLELKFKVFPARQERVYDFAQGDWSMRIHYTLTKRREQKIVLGTAGTFQRADPAESMCLHCYPVKLNCLAM